MSQAEPTPPTDPPAAHLASSVHALKASADQLNDSADRRTELAADRTVLAAERTYAAWIRTGLAALASGIGARALLSSFLPFWLVLVTGSVLIAFSGFCFYAAVWRELAKVSPAHPEARRLPRTLIVALSGFLGLVALATLVAIWLRPAG